MSNSIAIIAGLFLMISFPVLLIGGIIFLAGGVHPLLIPSINISGLVVVMCATIGIFDHRVFRHAISWLGLW